MDQDRVIIVGAGVAGLCAAIELAGAGVPVTVLEKEQTAGGKMRQVQAGHAGIDAGPTVFTMRWVFEDLFARSGRNFSDYVTPVAATLLARHAWDSPAPFDLHADPRLSEDAIGHYFDAENARGFTRFLHDAARIHDTLLNTFMSAQRPGPVELSRRVGLSRLPSLLQLRPFTTMWQALGEYFPDPRLQQLFGRYATYVGSSPFATPATLMLVAHVECQGVWLIEGGMIALARGLQRCAEDLGVAFRFGAGVQEIVTRRGRAVAVKTSDNDEIAARAVIANADVSAFAAGHLGGAVSRAAARVPPARRSLSAVTWALHTQTKGFPLVRHNVFFSDHYKAEFDAIFSSRRLPAEPTVYICAQDRDDTGERTDGGDAGAPERLLCLVNAPPTGDTRKLSIEELDTCRIAMSRVLARAGLTLEFSPETMRITTPSDFEGLFPGSGGALYGPAAHGWNATFQRSGAKSRIPGLYLAGGTVHPGPGVPMAALSGGLAAQALMADLTSASASRKTAITGGTSTR